MIGENLKLNKIHIYYLNALNYILDTFQKQAKVN